MSLKTDMLTASAAAAQTCRIWPRICWSSRTALCRRTRVPRAPMISRTRWTSIGWPMGSWVARGGLGLGWVFDLASSERKLDATWNAEVNAKINALVP